ncbi:hypothetical protein [Nonomuraea pusilla]|uniref:hypothetical protein n=1 Tax=Nonomuraea pusilla TaxID=46177 RepID=UPI000B302297|nr:hypothetical protein [Nonomuraea pusilla]
MEMARALYEMKGDDGKRRYTVQQIADRLGVSRATICRPPRRRSRRRRGTLLPRSPTEAARLTPVEAVGHQGEESLRDDARRRLPYQLVELLHQRLSCLRRGGPG